MQEKVIRERRERLFSWAQDRGIKTLWVTMPPNRTYLCNYTPEDGPYGESSGWLLFSSEEGYLLTDNRYTLEAEKEAVGVSVVGDANLWKALDKIIGRLDLSHIGYEENYVTVGQLNRLMERIRREGMEPKLSPIDEFLSSLREVKDPYELEIIREGAEILSRIMEELEGHMRIGVSERYLAHKVREIATEFGAEELSFPPIVASGPNSALPHARPTDRVIRENEPVLVDIGIRYMSYMTDMTRTFFPGGPKEEFRTIYRAVREAQEMAIEALYEGMEGKEADSVAREYLVKEGFGEYFSHGLGHGIGLSVHEAPRLGPNSNDRLKSHSIVTVEPGLYIPNKGGVRIEDMLVLRNGKGELLTRGVSKYEF